MQFTPPPREFTGNFSAFFSAYVAPNLPSPERVKEFDCILRRYLHEHDPIYLVRYVRHQTRGTEYRSDHGCRMRPTDNAPVWWLHAMLCSKDGLPTEGEPSVIFDRLPYHLFRVGRMETLNSAGFHAAHIIPAKNGDSNWMAWDRKEMSRRMLVNIHPCNVFLVAKTGWTKNGGRPDILAWIIDAYLERYGHIMQRFLADVGGAGLGRTESDPVYSYGPTTPKPVRRKTGIKALQARPVQAVAGTRVLARPCIWRKLVGSGMTLSIQSLGEQYIIPHDDLVAWAGLNTKALQTVSWRENGIYSWPRPTRDMLKFLQPYSL